MLISSEARTSRSSDGIHPSMFKFKEYLTLGILFRHSLVFLEQIVNCPAMLDSTVPIEILKLSNIGQR